MECKHIFSRGVKAGKQCTSIAKHNGKCTLHSKKQVHIPKGEPGGGETITLTFGDCAENHHGMQEIGQKALTGLNFTDLKECQAFFEEREVECEMHFLSTDSSFPYAYILIVRKGVNAIVDVQQLYQEQMNLTRDKKAFMRGKVVNKIARHNLCFSDFDQEPDYENGKGTVVSFDRLPILSTIRYFLGNLISKMKNLQCEANYYYDTKKTYIGFHGDTERKIVVAVRIGESFPIHFQWFLEGQPIGELFSFVLNSGDMYFMSEKAVGSDWMKKKIPTLRHAAGDKKIVVTW